MAMEIQNAGYGFACRMDNVKEAAEGNRVMSGCAVAAQGTPDMTVDIAAGVVRIDNAYMTISAVDNEAVDAAHASLDRWDTIRVGKDGTVDYTAGTAAANPLPPDLAADHILLATIFVENQSTTVDAGDIEDQRIIHEDSGVQVPIGAILSWAKSMTGVPSLPTGFAECDGSTISDAESPLNGEDLPDLNGDGRYLKGAATSGAEGGAVDGTHIHKIMNNTNSDNIIAITGVSSNTGQQYYNSVGTAVNITGSLDVNMYTTPIDSTPPNYTVVMIMRIK